MKSTLYRVVVITAILASFVAFLDGSIVNIALPALQKDLGGGLAMQQWVVDAFLLTLGSFILLAGSLSDLFGRKKVLAYGLVGFGISSLLCAFAPNSLTLIIGRALQGVSGALLVPSSLALITAYVPEDQFSKAIGQWTAWTGIAFVIGPLLGGFLIDAFNWRYIFAINVIPIIVTMFLLRFLPREEKPADRPHLDIFGAILCVLGLSGAVFGLIEQQHYSWSYIPLIIGLLLLAGFVWYESRTKEPMLPLRLFRGRNFSAGNIATVAIYAGLSAFTFILVIFLQQTAHYSALQSGLSLLPVTLIMFFFSSRIGNAASKYGPRWFMTAGPIVAGLGLLLMAKLGTTEMHYWTQVFPAIVIFGLGLSLTVAPLTVAILADVDKHNSGVASAVNNAVSRIAGLVAVAGIGVVFGASQDILHSYKVSLILIAGIVILGGAISALGIRNRSV